MFQKLKKYDIAYYCILLGLSLILGGLISVILMIPIVLIFKEPFLNSPLFTLTTLFSTALSALLIIIFATRKKAATLRDLGLKKENFIKEYISSRDKNIESMITLDTIKAIHHQSKERLSECCIIAYRKKHRLNVNYKWHN